MENITKRFECPLQKLQPGSKAVNVYPISEELLSHQKIFRRGCPACQSGYLDFLASNVEEMRFKPGMFEVVVSEVFSPIKRCGKVT